MISTLPKPVLALTIGVVGHRLHRPTPPGEALLLAFDAAKVRAAMDQTLDQLLAAIDKVKAQYAEWFEPDVVVAVITSLAEEADLIAARAAKDKKIAFDAVLPFATEEYAQTFEDAEARAEFRDLLKSARSTLILPRAAGADEQRSSARSYAQAGATVLAQSDLLLAVWDGAPARGEGGTAETVDEAARQATPVIVIDPAGDPKPPPPQCSDAHKRCLSLDQNRKAVESLEAAQAAADKVAVHYSHAFRTAFVANFLFGALALFCVAASFVTPPKGRVYWATAEFFFVVAVIAITAVANSRRWRHRWFEARETAERLRLTLPFWMTGIWPHALSADQPAWTGWYVRSLLREQPIFSGNLAESEPDVRATLVGILDDQIYYHGKTIKEAERSDHVLEWIGKVAVICSIAEPPVLLASYVHIWTPPGWIEHWLTATAIALPALATACYGIRLLGDFEDTALRSQRARAKLRKLRERLTSEPPSLGELRTRARQTSAAMLADVESWRMTVESRNLSV
jgi:hypothetical protein